MIYHKKPKYKINCLYCNKKCSTTTRLEPYHYNANDRFIYKCYNHSPLSVEFININDYNNRATKSKPWYFGAINIKLYKLMLGFSSFPNQNIKSQLFGPSTFKENYSSWKVIENFPNDYIISTPIDDLLRYLNLYRVFS